MTRELITAAVLLSAWTGAAHAQGARAMLRYTELPANATYVAADTTGQLVGGTGGLTTDAVLATTVSLAMRASGDSVHVTTRLTDMQGSMSAMGQSMETPKYPGWDAPAEFVLGGDGGVRLVTSAAGGSESAAAAELQAYARMFPRLPGRAVARGETWTDSATQNIDEPGVRAVTRVRTTGSWIGDSTVNGVRVHVLRYHADHVIDIASGESGTGMTQKLSGRVTTIALWDPARNLMIEVHENGELRGIVDAPARALENAQLVQRLARHARLQ